MPTWWCIVLILNGIFLVIQLLSTILIVVATFNTRLFRLDTLKITTSNLVLLMILCMVSRSILLHEMNTTFVWEDRMLKDNVWTFMFVMSFTSSGLHGMFVLAIAVMTFYEGSQHLPVGDESQSSWSCQDTLDIPVGDERSTSYLNTPTITDSRWRSWRKVPVVITVLTITAFSLTLGICGSLYSNYDNIASYYNFANDNKFARYDDYSYYHRENIFTHVHEYNRNVLTMARFLIGIVFDIIPGVASVGAIIVHWCRDNSRNLPCRNLSPIIVMTYVLLQGPAMCVYLTTIYEPEFAWYNVMMTVVAMELLPSFEMALTPTLLLLLPTEYKTALKELFCRSRNRPTDTEMQNMDIA